MKRTVSAVLITKNPGKILEKTLSSVYTWVDEIIIVDDFSTDGTRAVAKQYGAKIFIRKGSDIGIQREYGIAHTTGEYILLLDADEVVSERLQKEIVNVLQGSTTPFDVYETPFVNHLWGKPLYHGGENYKKICLFKKNAAHVGSALAHQPVIIEPGKTKGVLTNPILHYSYQSLALIKKKFQDYALRVAIQKKKDGERSSIGKIITYPLHMIWARFITDKGYEDGIFRLPLDILFGYMELMTHLYLFTLQKKKPVSTSQL